MNVASEKDQLCVFQQKTWQPIALTSIRVRFVTTSPLNIQIKQSMKTLTASQNNNKPIVPSLFQIAARFDHVVPATTLKSPQPLNQASFTGSRLSPAKATATPKAEARTTSPKSTKRPTRSAAPKDCEGGGAGQPAIHSPCELKKTEFFLNAPSAKSVKLAADFTDWDKSPLDLIKIADGVWHTAVPLPPGHHSYRFIVDGQWCDDPLSVLRMPNPFGTVNAVTIVP